MSQRLTAQEAAMYLGQQFQTFYTATMFRPEMPASIIDVDPLSIYIMQDNFNFTYRLLLRPFTDMTEEELMAFADADGYYDYTCYKDKTQTARNIIKCGEFSPAALKYLLSIGIDVFDLIEQGKALDKTTTSPKSAGE